MIKSTINILVMLFCSWGVYATCQGDLWLPSLAAGNIIVSLCVRRKSAEQRYVLFERIPLPGLAIASLLAGFMWRVVIPIPPDANSPLLPLVSALQAGSIIAAFFIALRPISRQNNHRLAFCAWLTVALSINVPFTDAMLLAFASFSFVALSVIIVSIMHAPSNHKYRLLYARDYVLFACLLIVSTSILFLAISGTIFTVKRAFFDTMEDYLSTRHYTNFLNISPYLNLTSPGLSGLDKRPVMQISMPRGNGAYLKMQVFDRYQNGIWSEINNTKKTLLPVELVIGQPVGQIMMFAPLENIIPSPSGVTAIKANRPYQKTPEQLIYAKDVQNSRILEFSQGPVPAEHVALSEAEFKRYTDVPGLIYPELYELAYSLTKDQKTAGGKALKLIEYLQRNFNYSLEPSFPANDQGLLEMLREKRPAYCTSFASALTLLLRSQGIPATVAAGFLTTEKINSKTNTYLARVKNAHAWTEALIPFRNKQTGQTELKWTTMDATPPSFENVITKKSLVDSMEVFFERMLLSLLRFKAQIENMDQEKLKLYVWLAITALIALLNRRGIISTFRRITNRKAKPKKPVYKTLDALRLIYAKYERHLKEKYDEVRKPSETDAEVIGRIRKLHGNKAVEPLEAFVKEFQGVRFGGKDTKPLHQYSHFSSS